MSSGGFAVFVRVSGRLRGMPGWPADVPRGLGVPCFPAAADPGERPYGSRTGQGPAGEAGAAGVLDAEGRDPIIGRRGTGGVCGCGCGPHGQLRCWRGLAAVIPPGGPRLAAAGHGAGPRGQRDQSGARPRRAGRGPDMGAITRCPRPGLLTLPPAVRCGRPGI